jgi:amino acid permease
MIPKNTTSRLQKGYCILFLALPFLAIAQDDFIDDIDDLAVPAPVDNYILLALLLGIYYGYRFFKTKHAIPTKKIKS